jgi:hypothetical protein
VGGCVSGVGDFNGDGIGDFIIGASALNVTSDGGAAYVIFGKTNASTEGRVSGCIELITNRIKSRSPSMVPQVFQIYFIILLMTHS